MSKKKHRKSSKSPDDKKTAANEQSSSSRKKKKSSSSSSKSSSKSGQPGESANLAAQGEPATTSKHKSSSSSKRKRSSKSATTSPPVVKPDRKTRKETAAAAVQEAADLNNNTLPAPAAQPEPEQSKAPKLEEKAAVTSPGKVSFQIKKKAPLVAPIVVHSVERSSKRAKSDTTNPPPPPPPQADDKKPPAPPSSDSKKASPPPSSSTSTPAKRSRSPRMSRSRSRTRSVTPASSSHHRRRRSRSRRSRSRSRSPRYGSGSSHRYSKSRAPAAARQPSDDSHRHRERRDRHDDDARSSRHSRSPVARRQHSASPQDADHRPSSTDNNYLSSRSRAHNHRTPATAASSSSYLAKSSSRKDETHDRSYRYGAGEATASKNNEDELATKQPSSYGAGRYHLNARTSSFTDHRQTPVSYATTAVNSPATPRNPARTPSQQSFPSYHLPNTGQPVSSTYFNSNNNSYYQNQKQSFFPHQNSYSSTGQSFQRFNTPYRHNNNSNNNSYAYNANNSSAGIRKPPYMYSRAFQAREGAAEDLNEELNEPYDSIEELSNESDAGDLDERERGHATWKVHSAQGDSSSKTSEFNSFLRKLARVDFSVLTGKTGGGGGGKEQAKTSSQVDDSGIKSPIRVAEDDPAGAAAGYSSLITRNLYESFLLRRSKKFSQLAGLCEDVGLELEESGTEESIRFLVRLDILRLTGAPIGGLIDLETRAELKQRYDQVLANLRARLEDQLDSFAPEPFGEAEGEKEEEETLLRHCLIDNAFKSSTQPEPAFKPRGIHLASDLESRGLLRAPVKPDMPMPLPPGDAGDQLFEQCLSLFAE